MKTFAVLILLALISIPAGAALSERFVSIRIRLFKDLEQLPIISDSTVKQLSQNLFMVEGKQLSYQGKKIASKNFIIKKTNSKFDLIANVDFNAYLAGVVSKEMPLSWPLEALKAQAVIARSYALTKIRERQNKVFHLDTDQMDQVFAFTNSEKAKKAVSSTDQVVLKDQKNKILKAFYHSDCGGQTVPASQVWKGAYDAGTAIDPWCANRKSNEWTYEVPKEEFYQRLSIQEPEAKLEVAENFKSKIQSLSSMEQIFSVQKIREIFGFSLVRNSPTSYQETDDVVQLKGKGFGHGAGLCQWGTLAQVRLGRSYLQVLEHYYPKATVTTNESFRLSQVMMSDLVFK
ncbi:MAG: SpoIID/LytB domain-containing protein [Pseudobdellovibrio sp.]